MRGPSPSYLAATRHPWACVLFVLPLLAIYEVGLYFSGPAQPDEVRNGADAWLRGILQHVGISPLYGAPVLLLGLLVAWSIWRRADRPRDYVFVWFGMNAESLGFALGLLCLSQVLFPALQMLGGLFDPPSSRLIEMATPGHSYAAEQLIGYVGAGIYEETLFRLLLFSGLTVAIGLLELRPWLTLGLAAILSALAFAGAHNLGPEGESFEWVVFLFRTCAGLYFTWIYQVRGFGIAVGAHASYDVIVGLLMRNG